MVGTRTGFIPKASDRFARQRRSQSPGRLEAVEVFREFRERVDVRFIDRRRTLNARAGPHEAHDRPELVGAGQGVDRVKALVQKEAGYVQVAGLAAERVPPPGLCKLRIEQVD